MARIKDIEVALDMFNRIHPDGVAISNKALRLILTWIALHRNDDDAVYNYIDQTWRPETNDFKKKVYFAPGESTTLSRKEAKFVNCDEWYPRKTPPDRFTFTHWVHSFGVIEYEDELLENRDVRLSR